MKNKKSVSSKLIVLGIAAAVVALSTSAQAQEHKKPVVDVSKLPPASTKQGVTYAGDIKAIFEKSCVKCHGDEKPKAGLKLTSLETTLKGTKEGK